MKLIRVLIAAVVALTAAIALQVGTSSGAGAAPAIGIHTHVCAFCGWSTHD